MWIKKTKNRYCLTNNYFTSIFDEMKNEKDQNLIKFYLGIITKGKLKNSNKNKINIILKKSGNITKKLNLSFLIIVSIYFIKRYSKL